MNDHKRSSSHDRAISSAFRRLRESDAQKAPSFSRLVSRPQRRTVSRRLASPRVLVASLLALALAAGFFSLLTPATEPWPEWTDSLAWKTSTDFLLETPGGLWLHASPTLSSDWPDPISNPPNDAF